jgi:hypothetical protein
MQKFSTLKSSACLLASCAFITVASAQLPAKFRLADLAGSDLIDLPNVESDQAPAATPTIGKGMSLANVLIVWRYAGNPNILFVTSDIAFAYALNVGSNVVGS